MLAVLYTRPLIAKYKKEITYNDRKDNQLKENMIALGNITSVVYTVLIIILLAKVSFVAEVFMFHRTFIEQKVKLWVSNGFNLRINLIKVTKRNFNYCDEGCAIVLSRCLWRVRFCLMFHPIKNSMVVCEKCRYAGNSPRSIHPHQFGFGVN